MKKQKVKQKAQEVLLQAVPITYEGINCWAPVDACDEKLLVNRNVIRAELIVEARSINQNSLWAVWYSQISKWGDENQTPEEVKCFCKLHFGVPLYRKQNSEFRTAYDKFIRDSITYEAKLSIMAITSVTRHLSKSNGQKYQAEIQKHYAEKGLVLEIL